MGYRHYYVVVLLYCIFGLTTPDALAQCGDPPPTACSSCGCDEGEAQVEAQAWKTYRECQGYVVEIRELTPTLCAANGGRQIGVFRNNPPNQEPNVSTYTGRFNTFCEARDPFQSGESACESPNQNGECFSCKDGCRYSEALTVGICTSDTNCSVNYQSSPTGDICSYNDGNSGGQPDDPPPSDDPPDDPPCVVENGITTCVTPDGVCASDGSSDVCADYPPPNDTDCGFTLCVATGNPPDPPNTDPPARSVFRRYRYRWRIDKRLAC